jgi:5-methyltetrahydropteroyltriglutamate--homocysteine methyltransferase
MHGKLKSVLRAMRTETNLTQIRVDQVGSLAAPKALQAAFERHALGEIGDDDLRVAQDGAIRDVVRKQEAIGLPVVTDGEFRRRNFQESFSAAVTGYDVPERPERLND